MSESEFTTQLLQYLRLMGWRTLHLRPARTLAGWRTAIAGDGKGFPDILCVRGERMVAIELKVRGKITPEQSEWLAALAEAGVETAVWRPEDWSEIEEVMGR